MLTVVMPVFNVERYVADAIRSVLAQTHRDFALLVADDGSTDGTLAAARAFEADPRVRVVTHANVGIANTMNAALAACDTEWVACMHGDDVMLPHRLERQLAFAADHPGVAVFSSLVDWIDETGRIVGRSRSPLTTPEDVRRLVAGGRAVAFPHPAVLFRRQAVLDVGGYRQEFWPAEDTELWNRMVARGCGVLVQPEVLLRYRLHAKSASMSKAGVMIQKLRWVERCIAAWREGREEPTWDDFLAARRAAGWGARLNEGRKDLSRTLWQTAIGHRAARRYHRLLPAVAGAVALEPGEVLPRLLPRLMGKGTRNEC